MKFRKCIIIFFVLFSYFNSFAQLQDVFGSISTFIRSGDIVIGFAAKDLETGITIVLNENEFFPMQSVYKFHLALAVFNMIDMGKFSLNQEVYVRQSDLLQDTWSPLRDKYPEGNVNVSIEELLRYAVSDSDNNACDILFRMVGGPSKVQKYLKGKGFANVNIVSDEAAMHRSWDEQYRNKTTPLSALELLCKFYTGGLLKHDSKVALLTMMTETTTGMNRIRGLLPPDWTVMHKTGTGGTGSDGKISAVNDIGLIVFPDGSAIALAVFIRDSKLNYDENERIIAEIAVYICGIFGKR